MLLGTVFMSFVNEVGSLANCVIAVVVSLWGFLGLMGIMIQLRLACSKKASIRLSRFLALLQSHTDIPGDKNIKIENIQLKH